MAHPYHPEDRPDPSENMPAMRARVPDHVSRGVFSTGAIVMTGSTEFILDFVQSLGRPHQVVARIVLPHVVMPQFADALSTNIELYRQRFGPLPNSNPTPVTQGPSSQGQAGPSSGHSGNIGSSGEFLGRATGEPSEQPIPGQSSQLVGGFSPSLNPASAESGSPVSAADPAAAAGPHSHPASNSPTGSGSTGAGVGGPGASTTQPRKPTAQEVYDELKMRDEIMSGAYANAVMIGHGPHEFSFDFITNFYPQSAVSSRVFVAAGQVARLLESLRTAWEQLRPRLYPPPPPGIPPLG